MTAAQRERPLICDWPTHAVRHQAVIALADVRRSGRTRDWSHIAAVTLNPERDSVVAATRRSKDSQPLAA